MNKYQEALHYVRNNTSGILTRFGEKHYKALRELVAKETPMKPQKIDEPDLYFIYHCPKCGATLMVDRNLYPNYLCHLCNKCGQKLDWSEE